MFLWNFYVLQIQAFVFSHQCISIIWKNSCIFFCLTQGNCLISPKHNPIFPLSAFKLQSYSLSGHLAIYLNRKTASVYTAWVKWHAEYISMICLMMGRLWNSMSKAIRHTRSYKALNYVYERMNHSQRKMHHGVFFLSYSSFWRFKSKENASNFLVICA